MNGAAFLLYGFDKASSKSEGATRVPEVVLLGLAALGGAAGAWAGMLLFRHKTQKTAFRWGVPVLLGLEVVAGVWAVKAGFWR